MIMNLAFENLKEYQNFINCKDVNSSRIRRFSDSPITQSIIHSRSFFSSSKNNLQTKAFELNENLSLKHYIITTGVTHHPNDWCGSELADHNTRANSFSFLHGRYLQDLQSGRAMLLFDQSLEGYQTPWLWEYFHNECARYNVPPQAVIYVTGNLMAYEQYLLWANAQKLFDRMHVIPYTTFEFDIGTIAKEVKLACDVEKNLQFKRNNIHAIKTFNCLQKRLRAHRIWFFKYLADASLLDSGLISMNRFDSRMTFFENQQLDTTQTAHYNSNLPMLIDGKNNNQNDDNYYIRRITDDVFKNTWVSVVSEAAAGESDQTIFISEKMFKPIVCFHPFIVVSNQGYLQKLRAMGYKTFEGFIDESYDTLPTVFERYEAIIIALKKIHAIEDKLSWFKAIEPILIHNYKIFQKNITEPNCATQQLHLCYQNYFSR